LVGGAILEDPPWYEGLSSAQSREDSVREWRTKLLERQSKPFAALVAAGPQEHPDWAETEFGAWAEAKLQVSPNVLQVISELRPHWPETITKITCPSLLLMGDPERGSLVTPEVAAQVTRRCPHFKVTRIRNAGHNIRREQFEQFMTAVTAFLADL
jgi:pimeloyl-ACP methyl ester carboxylesterase